MSGAEEVGLGAWFVLPAGRSLELAGAVAGPASSSGTKGKDVITDEFLFFRARG